ncbi:MAG: DUF368 domain-containing protein [Eubacteriales bacterium]|nr:DUF368 domain-containing protein [Eubacteriales bacterium]
MNTTFLSKCLAGLLIGIGFVLPGVSGGVMAVSFGLYLPMLNALTHFFKSPKEHFLYLLPIAVGGAIGTLLGANALAYVMARWEIPMLYLFIGFILGGIPTFLKEADEKGFQKRYLFALLLGVALALPMLLTGGEARGEAASLTFWQSLAAGGLYAFGTVVPGISTSFLLIRMGWYRATLTAISTLSFSALLPIALGFLLVALLTMKLVSWLFARYHGYAYYAVLGFVLVSIGLVFPGFGTGTALAIQLLMLLIGALSALQMNRLKG